MKKTAIAILAVMSLATEVRAQQPGSVEALDGVDPVLLVQGKEVSGKPELKVVRGRFEYLFSSPATKATFERNPSEYEIQLNGLCARMGKATNGRPSDYLVYDGKIYIFGSDECHRKFEAEPKKYLPLPAPPFAASTKAINEGGALVERAVTVIGGGARLDAIRTYIETATQTQRRSTGDVPITVKTMWRFPGDVRMERTMTLQDRTMSSATLMTQSGMWFLSQDRAFPIVEAGRPSMELDYGRQIVPLLRGRRDRGFQAAALGRETLNGVTVDRVRILKGGVDVILALEPSSGRVQAISFSDRNSEGEVGQFTIVFSDYREVEGLSLPFAERASFNGVVDRSLSRRIDRITINPSLDATLFQPGTPGGQ
jgi:YHS domain-containing protein/outer membrane lipoprotein-sorting protein